MIGEDDKDFFWIMFSFYIVDIYYKEIFWLNFIFFCVFLFFWKVVFVLKLDFVIIEVFFIRLISDFVG